MFQAPFHTIGLLALAPPALGAARSALARFIERMDGHLMVLSRDAAATSYADVLLGPVTVERSPGVFRADTDQPAA